MKFTETSNEIKLQNPKNFDLGQTLDCGQCFRFEKLNEKRYKIIAFGKVLTLKQEINEIIFENTTFEEFNSIWLKYFDIDTDYEKIKLSFPKNKFLQDAYDFCPGIRILNQDPWETLCSFIISQNNNIPRIKKIISKLCELFGEKIGLSNSDFSFPSAKTISSLSIEDLEPIKSGFRAKYIIDAAQKIESKKIDLDEISKLSLEEAQKLLMNINGVGPKVSMCVLLYGFHKLNAFPMDIWMKKVMNNYFEGKDPNWFGENCGIAQQYLYHYSRMNADKLF